MPAKTTTTVSASLLYPTGERFDGDVEIAPAPASARVTAHGIVVGSSETVTVVGGVFTVELEPGYYWVKVPGTRTLKINVPVSSLAINMSAIIVDGAANVVAAEVGIPAGGATGQVLTKLSDESWDVGWTTPSA